MKFEPGYYNSVHSAWGPYMRTRLIFPVIREGTMNYNHEIEEGLTFDKEGRQDTRS